MLQTWTNSELQGCLLFGIMFLKFAMPRGDVPEVTVNAPEVTVNAPEVTVVPVPL